MSMRRHDAMLRGYSMQFEATNRKHKIEAHREKRAFVVLAITTVSVIASAFVTSGLNLTSDALVGIVLGSYFTVTIVGGLIAYCWPVPERYLAPFEPPPHED